MPSVYISHHANCGEIGILCGLAKSEPNSIVYHLPDQLITGQAGGDPVERRAAQAAFATQTVTVPALLVLQHHRALQLEG